MNHLIYLDPDKIRTLSQTLMSNQKAVPGKILNLLQSLTEPWLTKDRTWSYLFP